MGPRTYIRGNEVNLPLAYRAFRSFNGAADLHPRKYGMIFKGRAKKVRFNGAADLHPRK
jgi:hypothetical protein